MACGIVSGWRVYLRVGNHRRRKDDGVASATLDVKLGMTWMEGCKLGAGEIHSGESTAEVQGDTLRLKATGDAVWVGGCE